MPTGVYLRTEEHNRNIGLANKGKIISVEARLKMSKSHKGKHFSKEHRQKISNALKGIIRNEEFRKKMSNVLKGKHISKETEFKPKEFHWNWQGGITKKNKVIRDKDRNSKKYKLWKQEVLQRDNSSCCICGSKDNLDTHHIKSFYKYPELRYNIDNGKILCFECHRVKKLK